MIFSLSRKLATRGSFPRGLLLEQIFTERLLYVITRSEDKVESFNAKLIHPRFHVSIERTRQKFILQRNISLM